MMRRGERAAAESFRHGRSGDRITGAPTCRRLLLGRIRLRLARPALLPRLRLFLRLVSHTGHPLSLSSSLPALPLRSAAGCTRDASRECREIAGLEDDSSRRSLDACRDGSRLAKVSSAGALLTAAGSRSGRRRAGIGPTSTRDRVGEPVILRGLTRALAVALVLVGYGRFATTVFTQNGRHRDRRPLTAMVTGTSLSPGCSENGTLVRASALQPVSLASQAVRKG